MVMPSIRRGGVERLASILLRGLDRERFRPELVVMHRRDENALMRAAIPADVPVTSLGKRGRLDTPVVLARLVAHLGKRTPDVVLGLMTYQNLMLLAASALRGGHVPVVATEHVTIEALRATRGKRMQVRFAARLYARAAAVVAVSDGLAGALVSELNLPADKVCTIYNPFDPDLDSLVVQRPTHPWFGGPAPTLVAVGRLMPQKAFPLMLQALAMVRREIPARLVVFGEGDLRPELEALVRDLGLVESVDFAGYVANPFPAMRVADAFVLSSDWEAFPFVLVEAQRAGAAIVSTDCAFGPNEIIEHERSGLLVPPRSAEGLAAAILRVLRDPTLAAELRRGSRDASVRFAPEATVGAYADLLEKVMLR